MKTASSELQAGRINAIMAHNDDKDYLEETQL